MDHDQSKAHTTAYFWFLSTVLFVPVNELGVILSHSPLPEEMEECEQQAAVQRNQFQEPFASTPSKTCHDNANYNRQSPRSHWQRHTKSTGKYAKIYRLAYASNPAKALTAQTSSTWKGERGNVGAKPSEKKSQDPAFNQRNNSTSPLRLPRLTVQKVPPLCNLLIREQITGCTDSFHMCHFYTPPITSAPRFTCLPWSFHFTSTRGTKRWKEKRAKQVGESAMDIWAYVLQQKIILWCLAKLEKLGSTADWEAFLWSIKLHIHQKNV